MSGSSWGVRIALEKEVEARYSLDGICIGGRLVRSRVELDARVVVDMDEIVERPARFRFEVVIELGPEMMVFAFDPVMDWFMFGRPVEESKCIINYLIM